MTGCRIGKVKMKNGGAEIRQFPKSGLTVYDSNTEWYALEMANKHVRSGRAKAVMVSIILDDGVNECGFDKKDGVAGTQILGSIDLLKDHAVKWMVGP